MKERVREILFHLLGPAVEGTIAIDLFAGTGALGYEALSRGATRAVFAERHFPTADGLARTATDWGIADRVDIRPGDVLLWPRRMPALARADDAGRPWCVFVSPPWSLFDPAAAERGRLLELVAAMQAAAPPGSHLVVESDEAFDPIDLPEPGAWRRRAVVPAVLYLHSRPIPEGPTPDGAPRWMS
jgi:16S rRNA (guanine966-N2)-methyltransferase